MTLDSAGTNLDSAGGSAPGGVDAGDATYIVTGMIAQVVDSAAGLSEGLQAAGAKIRTTSAADRLADAEAPHGLTLPGSR